MSLKQKSASPIKPSYQNSGFVRATSGVSRRLIIALDGVEKCGKTHFALTAPGPICTLQTDTGGLEGVIQKFQKKKEIWVCNSDFRTESAGELGEKEAARAAGIAWDKLMKAYQAALGQARTIVVDKATNFWEILRMSRFGKLDKVMPHHYGPVNSEYKDFIRMAYEQDKTNLILLHNLKDEYVNDKNTGAKRRAGFADTGFEVQINAVCWKDMKLEEGANPLDKWNLTVQDCRQNPDLEGITFTGEDCNFTSLAMAVFEDTSEKDWQ